MDKIKGQLAGVAALLGVIAAIGGGFVKYGEIVTKLDALESQEHSTVDTSSIESSFGSRLFTNGFFLNNQLTDFSFKSRDENNKLIKNRPEGGKRPLSSMSPIIILDKNKKPTSQEVQKALDGHLCRCGSHSVVLKAIDSLIEN